MTEIIIRGRQGGPQGGYKRNTGWECARCGSGKRALGPAGEGHILMACASCGGNEFRPVYGEPAPRMRLEWDEDGTVSAREVP